jgi:hypothetical protein
MFEILRVVSRMARSPRICRRRRVCKTPSTPPDNFRSGQGPRTMREYQRTKTIQMILHHPKSPHLQPFYHQFHPLIPDHLISSVGGPERAVPKREAAVAASS